LVATFVTFVAFCSTAKPPQPVRTKSEPVQVGLPGIEIELSKGDTIENALEEVNDLSIYETMRIISLSCF